MWTMAGIIPNMPSALSHLPMCVVNDKVYTFGGYSSELWIE